MMPNDILTFAIGCDIFYLDFSLYACFNKDKPFVNLEDDIIYFNVRGEVNVSDDMNAPKVFLQHDAQQSFTQHASQGMRM